ncbi:MAG: DNA primase, partial [Kangiellaceae bacterium]|nr:DNA primase [Kangiellaceae bacterium]
GMEVPREASLGSNFNQNNELYETMEKVAAAYQLQLKHHPNSRKAIEYLKNRGLSGEIAKQYAIGYAPPDWQNLLGLEKDQKALQENLVKTGMMIKKDDGRAYDRFRDRIMFPIRNRRGQVLGFGGRVIDKGEPKYLNSPETVLFHKGRELYGIYEMRRQLRNIDQVIIVEGYMDVVALAQYGIYNAVATLGTATTSDHLLTLFRICPSIVFCFDGDKAGRAAALRALNHALPLLKEAREIRLMFLPEGEDPDSMVRNIGSESFLEQVQQATTLFDYLFEYLTSQVDMNTFEGPAKLVHLAKPFITEIKEPILLARFQQKLSQLTGLSEKQLESTLEPGDIDTQSQISQSGQNPPTYHNENPPPEYNTQGHQPQQTVETPPTAKPKQSERNKAPFRRAIALLLQYPDALPAADLGWLKPIEELGAQMLYEIYKLISNNEAATTAILVENWREKPEYPHLIKLANMELHADSENVHSELCEIFKRLEKNYLLDQWDRLTEKLRNGTVTGAEKDQLKQLQKAIYSK